jgi:hypothetical protein
MVSSRKFLIRAKGLLQVAWGVAFVVELGEQHGDRRLRTHCSLLIVSPILTHTLRDSWGTKRDSRECDVMGVFTRKRSREKDLKKKEKRKEKKWKEERQRQGVGTRRRGRRSGGRRGGRDEGMEEDLMIGTWKRALLVVLLISIQRRNWYSIICISS